MESCLEISHGVLEIVDKSRWGGGKCAKKKLPNSPENWFRKNYFGTSFAVWSDLDTGSGNYEFTVFLARVFCVHEERACSVILSIFKGFKFIAFSLLASLPADADASLFLARKNQAIVSLSKVNCAGATLWVDWQGCFEGGLANPLPQIYFRALSIGSKPRCTIKALKRTVKYQMYN